MNKTNNYKNKEKDNSIYLKFNNFKYFIISKIGSNLIYFSIIFYILQSIYFGFNLTTQSDLDVTADYLVSIFFTIGVYLYIYPLFDIYRQFLKQLKINKK